MKLRFLFIQFLLFFGIIPSICQSVQLGQRLSKAEQLFYSGNIIQSEVELNIISNDVKTTNNDEFLGLYYSLRSLISFKTERYNDVIDYAPKALRVLKPIPNLYKNYIQCLYSLAASYYEVERLDEACSTYLSLIKENSKGKIDKNIISSAYCELGYVYEDLGDSLSAKESYQLGQKVSNDIDISQIETYQNLYGLCSIYSRQNLLKPAIHAIDQFLIGHTQELAVAPYEYLKLLSYKASLLYKAKLYEEAEEIYNQLYLVLKNSDNILPVEFHYLYNKILLCYVYQGKTTDLKKFLPIAKKDLIVYNSYVNLLDDIASTFFTVGNYKECINYFKARLSYNSTDTNISIIRFLLGRALFLEKQYDEALQQLLIVRQNVIEGKTEGFNNIYGLYATIDMIYFLTGDYLASYKTLTESEFYIYYGDINEQMNLMIRKAMSLRLYGDYDKAMSIINDCLTLSSKHEDINSNIKVQAIMHRGLIYVNMKEYSKAIDMFTQSIEMSKSIHSDNLSDLSVLNHNIGKCYIELKDYSKALSYLDISLGIQKDLQKINPKTLSYIEICKSHIK